MATNNSSVVLDSSALVALLKVDDADHARAVRVMDEFIVPEGFLVFLPLEVMAETLNIIGKKEGKLAAVAGGNAVLERESLGEIALLNGDIQTLALALSMQAKAAGSPSFVDCLVMAHADQQKTSLIFGFDAAFRKNGYHLPGK